MNTEELFLIMDKFSISLLSELTVEDEKIKISMKKDTEGNICEPHIVKQQDTKKEKDEKEEEFKGIGIRAPLVGTFYRASSPEEPPYVQVGDHVKKGEVVGLIEAMKLMNEIVAPVDGVIEAIMIENEELVGFDQLLVKMKE